MFGLGASPLYSATPSYTLPTKNDQADCPQQGWVGWVGELGWVGVVIVKLKANLSSTGTGLPTGTELGKSISGTPFTQSIFLVMPQNVKESLNDLVRPLL